MKEIHFNCNPAVCPKTISFEYDEDTRLVYDIYFQGGCEGNTKAIAMLCYGQSIDTLIWRLSGITCGSKGTSCSDQLAQALMEV